MFRTKVVCPVHFLAHFEIINKSICYEYIFELSYSEIFSGLQNLIAIKKKIVIMFNYIKLDCLNSFNVVLLRYHFVTYVEQLAVKLH
jgi:hypothetical protein